MKDEYEAVKERCQKNINELKTFLRQCELSMNLELKSLYIYMPYINYFAYRD